MVKVIILLPGHCRGQVALRAKSIDHIIILLQHGGDGIICSFSKRILTSNLIQAVDPQMKIKCFIWMKFKPAPVFLGSPVRIDISLGRQRPDNEI